MKTTPEQMAQRDAITHSPEQRAKWLWDRLQGNSLSTVPPKPWDLICFCAETFALLSAEIDFLKPVAIKMVSIIYTAHYHTEEIYPSSCPYPLSKPSLLVKAGALPTVELTLKDENEKR